MKYCEIFLRSGGSITTTEMEEDEAAKLQMAFKEQAPGILEFKDDVGVLLLRMADIICVCCNDEQAIKTAGFT